MNFVHDMNSPEYSDAFLKSIVEKTTQLFDVKRRRQELDLVQSVAGEAGARIPYPSALTTVIEDEDRYYEIFLEIAVTHVHSVEDPTRYAAVCLLPSKDFRLLVPQHQLLSRTTYTTLAIILNLLNGDLNPKVRKQVDQFIKSGNVTGPNLYFRKPFRPHPHMRYLFKQSPSARDKELLAIYLQTMNRATAYLRNILENPFILEISPSAISMHEMVEKFLEMVTNQEYELKLGHGHVDTIRCVK